MITLDFETKSEVDLKSAGIDIYAGDLSTDIICMAAHTATASWLWYAGETIPLTLATALEQAKCVQAHNARFDQLIYDYIATTEYGFPVLSSGVWYCTQAQCRVNAFPASLDGATRALNSRHKKDHTGKALIRKLSSPDKKTGEFNTDPELITQMGEYCLSDVRATVDVLKATRRMQDREWEDWRINERINDRGVKIDVVLAGQAMVHAANYMDEIAEELTTLTDGAVTRHTQHARAKKWLNTESAINLTPEANGTLKYAFLFSYPPKVRKAIRVEAIKKRETISISSLDTTVRKAILKEFELLHLENTRVYKFVKLLDNAGKSSVSKFKRMIAMADPTDHRVRGVFIYAGAGQTQRYASRGLQLHNMGRVCKSPDEAEDFKASMLAGEGVSAPIMENLAQLLRPCLIPDTGKVFVVGDWSSIEARILPWLSGSVGGEKKLQVFRDGKDVYVEAANAMGLTDRQIGKVAELALGFGGAVGAFSNMATVYGLSLDVARIKTIVRAWRSTNEWAVDFWKALEKAAKAAVRAAMKTGNNDTHKAGRVEYHCVNGAAFKTLLCILPDGTVIQYPKVRFKDGDLYSMKTSVQPSADSTAAWPEMQLWGGILAENVTQALAAGLLREKLKVLDLSGLPVVAHVHDEIVCEVHIKNKYQSKDQLQTVMEVVPEWGKGLPLKAEPTIMVRYGK